MLKRTLLSHALVAAVMISPLAALAQPNSSVVAQAEQYRSAELAGITEGTYRAENSDVRVIIKKELSRYAVNFYALMTVGSAKTALFKVDPVDGATLAFTQISMGAQHVLKTNDQSQPSYAAQTINFDGPVLVLTATNHGASSGCPQSLRLKLDKGADDKWVSLADIQVQKLKVNKDAEIDLVMTYTGPMREYALNIVGGDDFRRSWSGNYLVREQIAGIGLMRKRQLDSMQASGFALSRHSDAVLVAMRSSSKKPVLRFVQLQSNSCLGSSSNIK